MSTSSLAEPSVQTLRAEAEANRARLTHTVEDLRTQVGDTATDLKERFSPSAIKAEVTDYVRDSRDQLWHSLEQKARDNPLQAVAVGAAIAYPAFKLLRAMPAPLLLVGAGILLSRTTPGQNNAWCLMPPRWCAIALRPLSARLPALWIMRPMRHGGSFTTPRTTLAKVSTALWTVRRVRLPRSKTRSRTLPIVSKTAVSDTADKVTSHAEGLSQQARQTVSDTWDKNPLLVAGIGLAIGAFIAAAFPSTQAEENLFGETSDALRRQAERAGVGAARTAVEGVAAAATEQGLSVDGLTKIGESLTDKVIAVAERGVEAALGETKPANTPPPNTEMGKSRS